MRRYPSLTITAIAAVLGTILTATIRLRFLVYNEPKVVMIAVIIGQLFWIAAGLMCMVRGNSYAEDNISEDGAGIVIYNIIKWGSIVLFMIADSFIAERFYELYIMNLSS